ncbi:putative glycosylphosphatidylinositol-alpha 1,2 mannosyltransferase [Aspergillus candidus]|uniref:Mannosyltransferase n=1 Tax=Aspergillus candidus TaxID=41067 RepID=A0A2I2F4U7_ASPCN|nr:Alg9-like mannosyltransferase family-domain-containing protein [Aspergillus candidus]PLB35672.1 Alg9-like mannosyltransferase family-domain-containing protein [Aspergillus candidus]
MSRPRRTRRSDHPVSVSSSSVSDSSDLDSISPLPTASSLKSSDSFVSAASSSTASNVFLFLVAFRLLNALSVRTFFQPDEFFQSLEPAWQIAFGKDQGAWITWEWRHQLRSSIHPLLFAAVYKVADLLALALRLAPATRADLLVAAPKCAQAVFAALADWYTWKLAGLVYGRRSREAWVTLALTVVSPWQWFCSTRTLSNCLETTLTVVALNSWPWKWSVDNGPHDYGSHAGSLRRCLWLAALACILRPTNVLVWMTLASVAWFRSTWTGRKVLTRVALLCGSSTLALSAVVDRLFYGVWTFPPLKFLYFNVAQSLAVFYGRNDWHYYASQGFPLLLTTALPFAAVGLYRALRPSAATGSLRTMQVQLAAICLVMPLALSLISHKEVRFIYPLLPALHVLAAPPLVTFFAPAVSRSHAAYTPRRLTLMFLLLANVAIALYTTLYHASGTLSVLSYLREQQQAHASVDKSESAAKSGTGISAGFLMPCHSTPWRSHLVHPNIHAWALSCEPPVGLDEAQKAIYVDEADQFYDDASQFLHNHMGGGLRHVPRRPSYQDSRPSAASPTVHDWPDYLVFFAQLEPTLKSTLRSSSYGECWRTFNTAWHDDWRRRGDIVVWCLDPAEQQAWRFQTHQRELEARDRQFDRVVKNFQREAHALRKQSSTSRWALPRPSMPRVSWPPVWPWSQPRRKTWLGIELPESRWTSSPSGVWDWAKVWRKKAKKAVDRKLWA